MFSILNFTKSKTNLNWLKADMHSHLLPGLDDGSTDMATSLKIIKRLSLLGLTDIYTTPHINEERYSTSSFEINLSLAKLQFGVSNQNVKINLFAAAEYMANLRFERIYQTEELMTFPGNYVLVEMPVNAESMYIDVYVIALQHMGYKVILAHPEKYSYCQRDMDRYKYYKSLGCLFQMNILSPAGYYGTQVKQAATNLLKEGMVDFVGTDLYTFKELLALEKYVLGGDAYSAFRKNPILNNELFTNIYA